jgi:hypothetical protein
MQSKTIDSKHPIWRNIMQSFKFELLSLRARLAAAVVGLLGSLFSLVGVLAVFASASGEADVVLAKRKPAPVASAVASRAPAKPAPG